MQDENKNKNNNFLLEDDLEINPLDHDEKSDYGNYVSDDNDDANNEDEEYFREKEDDYYYDKEKNNNNESREEYDEDKNALNAEKDDEGEDGFVKDNFNREEEKKDDIFNDDEENKNENEDACMVSKSKIILAKSVLENIKDNSEKLLNIFSNFVEDDEIAKISLSQLGEKNKNEDNEQGGNIIEGVFDGENMIGPDGKQYSVPANYASKSKLVEGDILKLTITGSGTFVYKQIGPIERVRIVGELDRGDDDSFFVRVDGKKWRILPASVTYFKGKIGDEVVLLIPKSGESKWAAVENIIRNKDEDDNN